MDPYDYEVAILVPSKKAVETIDISSSSEGEDGAPDRVHVKQEEADDAAAMDCVQLSMRKLLLLLLMSI